MKRIGIIGAGAFGTALGCALALGGRHVDLWGRNPGAIAEMAKTRRNQARLPEATLPKNLFPTSDLSDLARADAVLLVVPAQQLRGFLSEHDLSGFNCPLVLCAKGIETGSGKTQEEILLQALPGATAAIATGPSFATDICAGKPTALTIACKQADTGEALQNLLSTPTLRLYLTDDTTGAQLGGALKNVIAIACGIVAGAELGESARAALMTRGFAEMSRLARAMGARSDTLVGLSGLGDLALTCSSAQSRNFAFGMDFGQQGKITTTKTVEGIATARAAVELGLGHKVDLPIATTVANVLEGKSTVTEAIEALMSRPLKQEKQ